MSDEMRSELIPVYEAARILGVSHVTVRNMLADGRLTPAGRTEGKSRGRPGVTIARWEVISLDAARRQQFQKEIDSKAVWKDYLVISSPEPGGAPPEGQYRRYWTLLQDERGENVRAVLPGWNEDKSKAVALWLQPGFRVTLKAAIGEEGISVTEVAVNLESMVDSYLAAQATQLRQQETPT